MTINEPGTGSSDINRDALVSRLRGLLEPHPEILFAYVHGSSAEGFPFRDVDVAVFLDEEALKGRALSDYETDLSTALTRALQLPIDVRTLNHAPLGFQFNVTNGRLLISRDDARRFRFVERTWIDYMDFRPIAEAILREAMR
jgi:predicted nucleotidyltransferase